MTTETAVQQPGTFQVRLIDRIAHWPWWLIIIAFIGLIIFANIITDQLYAEIFRRVTGGIGTSIKVAVVAYLLAISIGLFTALGRVAKNPIVYNLATLYVQVIRGVPILVQIIYVAFVITPALVALLNAIGLALVPVLGPENFLASMTLQDIGSEQRVTIALAIAYGGFEAETFRAGIESIGRGQMEAARSLGMSYLQAMRYIVLPQAIRRVLPPLGNDFVSMIKDSSLVSVLGVRDMTQEARLYAAASFRYLETYSVLAFNYLVLTITLSLGVKALENRLGKGGKGS
ncbi:putative glutamine ABC transporter permease protein GlnM [Thermoflexales bacterium]|nr:putative glutamine ABC transporter permease protein GlnM [Thermoflexales bacterium]